MIKNTKKELKDCNIGDFVIMWCIGWNAWDNETVKVLETGTSLIDVKYKDGRKATMSGCVKVKVCNF